MVGIHQLGLLSQNTEDAPQGFSAQDLFLMVLETRKSRTQVPGLAPGEAPSSASLRGLFSMALWCLSL